MFRRVTIAALMCITLASILAAQQTPTAPPELVDINSASLEQIEAVFEDAELSARIIEGRPYANKRQLLTRELITSEEYERVSDRIVARRVESTP